MKNLFSFSLIFLLLFSISVKGQYITKYPDIPRIDVHAHISDSYSTIDNYLIMRDTLLKNGKMDMAMWINLGGANKGESGIDTVTKASKGRIMTAISDFTPHKGVRHNPKDLAGLMKKGYVGYKIWYGPYYRVLKEEEKGFRYVDDAAMESTFTQMEKLGILATSIHIADPNGPFGNRGKWAADPVAYWRQIVGMERVLQRHPNLTVIAAHCCWLICQDAQIDYLRYMMETYPKLYLDLAATEQYYYLVNRENLRDFIITYSDRIMFGTDRGVVNTNGIRSNADRYARFFQMLETDDEITLRTPMKGLDLPKEALEKIYYKNAARLYPGLAERMTSLGYKL